MGVYGVEYGCFNRYGPHRFLRHGNIRNYGLVEIGMGLQEEVHCCGGGIRGLIGSSYAQCGIMFTSPAD